MSKCHMKNMFSILKHKIPLKRCYSSLLDPTIGLSSETKEYYMLAKSFADKEMAPFMLEWDEKQIFPVSTLKKAADLVFHLQSVKKYEFI